MVAGLTGWTVIGEVPKDLRKFVVIGAPHTSNWDLYGAVFGAMALDFGGNGSVKDLFKFPLGGIMRWFGGIPVDRSKSTNMVDFAANLLKSSDNLGD